MFFISQKPNIKRSPNGIKTDGELFWNICDFWEEESTRDDARGGHEIGAHAHLKWARPPPSWAIRKADDALLWPQESYLLENDLGEGFNPIGVTDLHI